MRDLESERVEREKEKIARTEWEGVRAAAAAEQRARAERNKSRQASGPELADPEVIHAWEGLETAMTALEAANAAVSRPLYRAAINLVVARAEAFAKAARVLSEALEE